MPASPERLLISSILRDRDFVVAMGANITPEMFHAFKDEFSYLERHYKRHRKVPTKFLFKQKFPDFTIDPVNDTGASCDEVRNAHIEHRLLNSIKDVTDYIGQGDVETAAKLMHKEIVNITAETGAGDSDLISDWQSLFAEAEAKAQRVNDNGLAGISTGFPSFDIVMGGYQPAEFHVVAARLGEFKSWVMLRAAAAALLAGKTVQFNSLEMSRSQVGFRMHSLLSGAIGKGLFSNLELQQGRNFDPRAYRAFLRSIPTVVKGSFHVTDGSRGRVSPMTVAAQIERNQPDIVFVDYIGLVDGAMGGDWRSIGQVSGEFKSIAQQYQIPLVAAAQLNRERGIGKDPAGAEALAGSDAIGQDADSVVTGKKMSESVLALKLAKFRHGPSGQRVYVDVRPAQGVFEEVSFNKAMALKDKDLDAQDAAEAAGPKQAKASLLGGGQLTSAQKPAKTVKKLVKRPSPASR